MEDKVYRPFEEMATIIKNIRLDLLDIAVASRRDFTNNLKTASQTGMEKSMENHPTYEDNTLYVSSFGETSTML